MLTLYQKTPTHDRKQEKQKLLNLKNKKSMMKKLLKNCLLPIAFCLLAFGSNAQTTITGNVFNDGNNNGVKGTTEVGYPYVVVNAYAPGATTPTATATTLGTPTASMGNYTITGLTAGTNYRLEFVNPTGYYNGAIGTASKSSVQFAAAGATNVNFGFRFAGVCLTDSDPTLVSGAALNGADLVAPYTNNLNRTLRSWKYSSNTFSNVTNYDASWLDIGTPYSLTSRNRDKKVFITPTNAQISSTLFAPSSDGPSSIYVADYSGANYTYVGHKLLVKLADIGINVTNQYPIGTETGNDVFGISGLMGISISKDGNNLYVVNAGNGKIVKLDISGVNYASLPTTAPTASNVSEITIPTSVANAVDGRFRPTALKMKGDILYIAGIHDNSAGTGFSYLTDLKVQIIAYNTVNNTFSSVFEYVPNFAVGTNSYAGNWGQVNWRSTYVGGQLSAGQFQPVVADFDFDDRGDLIIGVSNRKNFNSASNFDGGYIVKASLNNGGTYTLENNKVCGNFTSTVPTTFAPAMNWQVLTTGPGGGWFFPQGNGFYSNPADLPIVAHAFCYSGGVYILPGKKEVVAGFVNVTTSSEFGVRHLSLDNGNMTGGHITGGYKQNAFTGVEAVCDMNPIEVGNRVWNDTNGNGYQDADEPSLVGVTVCLYNATNTQVATAITDANGNYIFSSAVGINTGSAKYGLTLTNGANYELRICALGSDPSVAGLSITDVTIAPGEVNGSPNTNTTLANNDAFLISGSPTIQFKMGNPGENNHNLDFGLHHITCTPPLAGADATACAGTCLDITGTSPTTGTWSAMAGNPAGATLGTTTAGVANVCFDATSTGTYNFIYNIGTSCEDTMSILVNPQTSNTTTATACDTYTWAVNSTAYTTSGTYTVTSTNANGCVHTEILNLTINASTSNTTTASACNTYTWSVNSTAYTTSGTYTETSTNAAGCPHTETLNLTINTSDATTVNASSCPASLPYMWNGQSISTAGTYTHNATNMNGCDSVVTLNFTISTTSTSSTSVSVCSSNLPYVWNGQTINTTGTYTYQTTSVSGCDSVATLNFVVDATASIGNYVFNDINHDGLQNNGEVGVSGVTVTLLNASNTTLATVTTDAYGMYNFAPLCAGTYKVQFSLPANYIFTGQNAPDDALDSDPNVFTGLTDAITLAAGDNNTTVDAGIFQPQPITATVGDRVWFDANADGIQDSNEYGVSGITVSLYNCSNLGTPIATTLTDAGGNYLFENVLAGSYSVGFSVPIGMVLTTQSGSVSDATNSDVNVSTERTACFNVVGGDHITYVDAGIKIKPIGTASLGDKVWNDANNNSIQDPTETGVSGVTVTLYDATGTTVITTTSTDGLGNYGFNGIPVGCYVVGFTAPSGYVFSTQNAGTDTTKNSDANATTGMTNQVCVTAGQNNPTIDAGIYNSSNTNSIGDKVWYDEDHDGIQDVTEYGYPGVVVTLYNCTTNAIIATTTTNASGNYLFDGIANGDYYVGFGFIAGYQFTGANADVAGIAGANNSDANPSNGLTSCVTLSGNTHITTVDAGIYPGSNRNATSSLGDIVWTDANNNGLQDNGETGVSNVTVNLYNCSDLNTPISTTTTDGLGNYIFTGLLGGSYVVEFNPTTLPAGYTFTTLGTNIEDENNSDANVTTGKTSCIALGLGEDKMSVDAGIVAPVNTVCLGDYVWIDLDNDGTQEANEPAVPGVTVKLYDNNTNTVLQVATTNAEGKYLFCGLTNGSTYSVGFENLPAGFTFTTSTGTLATTDNSDANPTTGRTTTVTLGATNDLTLDAGIYSATTAVVGNYVWYDEDADGIQDAPEAPIAGVLVTLYDNTNTAAASAVTDANGGYLFTNVTPGTYTIGFAGYPSTLVPTTKGADVNADDDSNIDPTSIKTDAFTVAAGTSNLTLDAGFKANPIAGLGNYVWLDVNDNGLQDASEPAISGVVVTLYAANGTTQLATAITDGNGAYSFPNLTAGDYVVGFSNIPINYIVANQVGSLNDALNNDITTIDMKTVVITLAAGTYNPNIDAGFKYSPLGVKELKATSAVITSTNDCQVNWFTTDEENTQSFNITRSINGFNFETVGTINASNHTIGRTNYTFKDDIEAIKNATNIFYQIQLNDIDGKQTISNVISVRTNNTNDEISIYPIPFTDFITINYPSTEASIVSIELTDVSGRIIRTMNQDIEQGNNTINLTGLTNIATGTYFLRIVNNTTGIMYSKKLTK